MLGFGSLFRRRSPGGGATEASDIAWRVSFLKTVTLFSAWDEERLQQLAGLFTQQTYTAGERIIETHSKTLHILTQGRVRVFVSRSRESLLAEETVLSFGEKSTYRRTGRSTRSTRTTRMTEA